MGFETVKNKLDEVKSAIKKAEPKKKLKIAMIAAWILVICVFFFTRVGRAVVVLCGYASFAFLLALLFRYVYLEFEKEIKLKQETQDEGVAESERAPKTTGSILDENFEIAEEDVEEDDYYGIKGTITTQKQPLRTVSDIKKTYYLFDASVFFALEEYTSERGYAISDIVYGDICLNDSVAVLAEAVKTRRCYVTTDVLQEIVRAEQAGKLKKGTSEFIEEDFGIWDAPVLEPENYEKLMSQKDLDENKKYKPKHYKLIWTAMCMGEKRNGTIFIVSTSKKMSGLAEANSLEVVDPFMIQEE